MKPLHIPPVLVIFGQTTARMLHVNPDGPHRWSGPLPLRAATEEYVLDVNRYIDAVVAEREKSLLDALDVAKRAILKSAQDTLWCDDSPAETVIDRIDAAASAHLQPTLDLAPTKPRCPDCLGTGATDYAGLALDTCGCAHHFTPEPNRPIQPTTTPTDEALLRSAVRVAVPRHSRGYVARWQAVMDVLTVGSNTAWSLCRRFGLDPEERVRRK